MVKLFDLAGIVFNLHVSELATHFIQLLHYGIPIYDLPAGFLINNMIWNLKGIKSSMHIH